MEKTNGRLIGIFGTVIIHLTVGIIIMALKISELHVKTTLLIDLELLTEFKNENNNNNNDEFRLSESSGTTLERALQGDAELLNIARNLASTVDPTISRDDYIDMVKDELIRSGQLGADNYIDQGRRQSSNNNDNFVPVNNTSVPVRNEERTPSEREVASVNYRGPTRIEYDLGGRTHTYIPTPIYKCQGAGIITLRIEVNQRGNVEKATVLARESSTDQCLVETAINSALASRFNSDINAPKIQTGTLMFQFVAK
jgi:hypothetical protein